MMQSMLSIMIRNLLRNQKIKNFSRKREKNFDFLTQIIF